MNGSSVKITILVDNYSPSDLIAEHGLAMHIESNGRQILFDTGQGGALTHNARSLGVALDRIDALVLSHLSFVRHLNDNAPVLAVIGGFHLLNAGSRRLEETITELRSLSPRMVVPCHCTGEHAVAMLSDTLGKKVVPGSAGLTLRF